MEAVVVVAVEEAEEVVTTPATNVVRQVTSLGIAHLEVVVVVAAVAAETSSVINVETWDTWLANVMPWNRGLLLELLGHYYLLITISISYNLHEYITSFLVKILSSMNLTPSQLFVYNRINVNG